MTTYEQIASIDGQIQWLQEQRASILQEWADANCPFKVGDVVEYADYRRRQQTMTVTRVWSQEKSNEIQWKVVGDLHGKAGPASSREDEFLQYQYDQNPDLFRRIEPAEQA